MHHLLVAPAQSVNPEVSCSTQIDHVVFERKGRAWRWAAAVVKVELEFQVTVQAAVFLPISR